jgi:hypothetical protein
MPCVVLENNKKIGKLDLFSFPIEQFLKVVKKQLDVWNGFCGILIDALNFCDVIFELGNFKTQTHTLLSFHAQFGVLVFQKVF